jgi:5-methylcytosine-specific restriction endonuclease McrA
MSGCLSNTRQPAGCFSFGDKVDTLICAVCYQEKPVAEFYSDPKLGTGHKHQCILCYKQMQKAWQKKNLKHLAEKAKAWRTAHPEQRQKKKDYCKAYYRNHITEFRLYYENHTGIIKDYYKNHKDRMRSALRAWRKANPERVVILYMHRRAREKEAPGTTTVEQLQSRIAFYGERCWICGEPFQAIDHVIPLTKGGTNWPANLRPICKQCNSKKQAQWPWPPDRFPTLCLKVEQKPNAS